MRGEFNVCLVEKKGKKEKKLEKRKRKKGEKRTRIGGIHVSKTKK